MRLDGLVGQMGQTALPARWAGCSSGQMVARWVAFPDWFLSADAGPIGMLSSQPALHAFPDGIVVGMQMEARWSDGPDEPQIQMGPMTLKPDRLDGHKIATR